MRLVPSSGRIADEPLERRSKMIVTPNLAPKTLMSICGGTLLVLTLASCTSAGADDFDDRRRCAGYRSYSDCMDRHQYRRDREQLINQEKALINAQQARENMRMLREIRRKRGEY